MEESTRSNRRTRNRPPYDLRRKVLLKNFLREQMTNVPESSSSTNPQDSENVDIVSIESSSEAMNVEVENLDGSENEEPIIESSSPSEEKNAEASDEEQNRGVEHHPDSPWKSTLVFDFSKITDLKVSRLLPVKRKSTSLSPEDIELIKKRSKVNKKNEEKCKKEIIKSSTPLKRKFDFSKFSSLKSNKTSSQPKSTMLSKSKSNIMKSKQLLSSKTQSKPITIEEIEKKGPELALNSLRARIRRVINMVQDLMKRNREEEARFIQNNQPTDDKCPTFITKNEKSFFMERDQRKVRQKVYESQQKSLTTLFRIEKTLFKRSKEFRTSKKPDVEVDKKENDPLCETSSKRSSDAKTSCTISTQCIPEDMDWSLHEIRKLEKVNQRLREENKLLSESLSSIMADVGVAFSPYIAQKRKPTDRKNRSRNVMFNSFDQSYPILSALSTPSWPGNNSNSPLNHSFEQRIRSSDPGRLPVLRSRSVLERAERRKEIRLRLSSKSMCHRPYVRISPRTLYKAKPCIITSCSSSEDFPLSNIYLPPTLSNRLDQNHFKTSLSRRSSMPEKTHRRTIPTRRSSCAFENKSSYYQSFLSLPKEAFY